MIILNEKDTALVVTVKLCFLRLSVAHKKLIRDYESVEVHFGEEHLKNAEKTVLEYVAKQEAIKAICNCYKVKENSIVRLWV